LQSFRRLAGGATAFPNWYNIGQNYYFTPVTVVVLAYGQSGQGGHTKISDAPYWGSGGNEEYYSQLKSNYKSTLVHTKILS